MALKIKKRAFFLTFLMILLAPFLAFAQNNEVIEKNLPNPVKTPTAGVGSNSKTVNPQVNQALSIAQPPLNEIARILTGQKTSSLMFDDEEIGDIQSALEAARNNTPLNLKKNSDGKIDNVKEENEKSYLYLGLILYSTPKDWAVWVNGQKISSQDNKISNTIYIKSIDPEKARLIWTLGISKWKILSGRNSEEFAPKINDKNQVEVDVALKTNQTYILSSNLIIEGYAAINKVRIPEKEKKPINKEEVEIQAAKTQNEQVNSNQTIAPTQAPTPLTNNSDNNALPSAAPSSALEVKAVKAEKVNESQAPVGINNNPPQVKGIKF